MKISTAKAQEKRKKSKLATKCLYRHEKRIYISLLAMVKRKGKVIPVTGRGGP
jgi:hypothetical protein